MSEIVKTVHLVDEDGVCAWADALADALMAASREAGDTLVDARSYCGQYEFITAVALLVDSDDPEDRSEWVVGLFAEPPNVGDEV